MLSRTTGKVCRYEVWPHQRQPTAVVFKSKLPFLARRNQSSVCLSSKWFALSRRLFQVLMSRWGKRYLINHTLTKLGQTYSDLMFHVMEDDANYFALQCTCPAKEDALLYGMGKSPNTVYNIVCWHWRVHPIELDPEVSFWIASAASFAATLTAENASRKLLGIVKYKYFACWAWLFVPFVEVKVANSLPYTSLHQCGLLFCRTMLANLWTKQHFCKRFDWFRVVWCIISGCSMSCYAHFPPFEKFGTCIWVSPSWELADFEAQSLWFSWKPTQSNGMQADKAMKQEVFKNFIKNKQIDK